MNEILNEIGWANPNFVDCDLWDARLSSTGVKYAVTLAESVPDDIDLESVEVMLSSPLTRALETANYLFCHSSSLLPNNVPKVVHPLLRERLYMSSDVGRLKAEIIADFPDWDMDYVPACEPWWYLHDEFSMPISISNEEICKVPNPYVEWRPAGKYSCKGEPNFEFKTRLLDLRKWLLSRPESTFLIVTHWGVIRGLTGRDVKNCEIAKVFESQLLIDPFVDE